ncbi:MAG TPA: hypothetical protein VGK32_12070 [Vicinamibacterales bacterium]|jgi:hypothetical protein
MARIPVQRTAPGISYAITDHGMELPVIDVTHPAFDLDPSADELAEIERRTLEGFARTSRLPAFVLRWMSRRSIVMRSVMDASGHVLPAIATYLQKLGPDNADDRWASDLDRKLLRSIGPVSMRLRLRDVARLSADGLAETLARDGRRPLHFMNIAGAAKPGPAHQAIVLVPAGMA